MYISLDATTAKPRRLGEEWVNCYYCYHQDHNNTNTDDDDDDNDNGGEDGNKRLLYGHTIDDVYGKHLGQRKTSQKFIHTIAKYIIAKFHTDQPSPPPEKKHMYSDINMSLFVSFAYIITERGNN